MSLIHNERTKLLANALDRASTGCVIAGLVAPTAVVGFGPLASVSTLVWLFSAFVLHLSARFVLGGLRQ